MASPPKPWERNGAASGASAPAPAASSAATPSSDSNTTTTSGSTPAIPARPASLTASVNQNAANYSRPMGAMGASPYGVGGVGSYGTTYGSSYGSAYSSPYSSPYSRYGGMGGYGSSMYGGYGGSMYGGSMYGGGGMYGGGMGGMPGDPNNPESLTNRFNMSTMATFQMLEGIVGAFGGFAQMLESTYMATHSSFFAMVAVAEQFGNLRQTLGSILGIFTIMRWIRTVFAKITGKPLPVDATSLTPASFAMFEGRGKGGAAAAAGGAAGAMPKPSRKPLIFFVLAAFGLPYVMSRVIKSLASNAEEEEKKRQLVVAQQQTIDPTKLEFCRVLYDFSPATQGNGEIVPGVDLEVHKGDLVAILSKSDPLGQPSEWWKCRARDGRIGYLPQTFLEVLKKPGHPVAAITGAPSISIDGDTRANSLSSILSDAGKKELVPALPAAKASDISVESFQKSQFFS